MSDTMRSLGLRILILEWAVLAVGIGFVLRALFRRTYIRLDTHYKRFGAGVASVAVAFVLVALSLTTRWTGDHIYSLTQMIYFCGSADGTTKWIVHFLEPGFGDCGFCADTALPEIAEAQYSYEFRQSFCPEQLAPGETSPQFQR